MAKSTDPDSKQLKAAVAAAFAGGGYARIETPEGEAWVVAPRGLNVDRNPFAGLTGSTLTPPVGRAAYSDRTAWLMAELSLLAYKKFESDEAARGEVAATLAAAGLAYLGHVDAASGTQAFVAEAENKFALVVFRGTEKNLADIRADLDARFLETGEGKAHRGFITAYESVHDQLLALLDKVPEGLPLYIAGHSLGGALASVAARRLGAQRTIAACYTFGSPRVGTREWSDGAKAPIYRVVNNADGVPAVPFSAFLGVCLRFASAVPPVAWVKSWIDKFLAAGFVGYQHVGDIRLLVGDADTVHLKTGTAATWVRLRTMTWARIKGFGTRRFRAFAGYFEDHAIGQYTTKLRKIAQDRNPGDT